MKKIFKNDQIAVLKAALRSIAHCQVELSIDKAMIQRNDFIRRARKALEDIEDIAKK